MSIKLNDALVAYINIRDDLTEKEREFKVFKAERKAQLSEIELFLKAKCEELGTDSVKAGGITAFTKIKDSVAIDDKDTFRNTIAGCLAEVICDLLVSDPDAGEIAMTSAIAAASAFDLLTLSANKINCKSYMADHEGLMPLGVKYTTEQVIQVRRGKS